MSATLLPEVADAAVAFAEPAKRLRFGYWLPVFGGWLRNVDDEQMDASWNYTRRLAQRNEEIGFDPNSSSTTSRAPMRRPSTRGARRPRSRRSRSGSS